MITTTYSAAAPYIRLMAAHATSRAIHSDTKRGANRAFGEVDGLMHALSVLLRSPEGENQPGEIAEEDTIPTDAVVALVQRWGGNRFGVDLLPIVHTPIERAL